MPHSPFSMLGMTTRRLTDGRIACRDDREVAPADCRDLLAHANKALSPVQQGIRIVLLDRGMDMLEAIRPTAGHRHSRVPVFGEAAEALRRPLPRSRRRS